MYVYTYIYMYIHTYICSNFGGFFCSFSGVLVKVLDFQSRGPCSNPLDGSKVDSAFHSSKVGKMSTSNFWGVW